MPATGWISRYIYIYNPFQRIRVNNLFFVGSVHSRGHMTAGWVSFLSCEVGQGAGMDRNPKALKGNTHWLPKNGCCCICFKAPSCQWIKIPEMVELFRDKPMGKYTCLLNCSPGLAHYSLSRQMFLTLFAAIQIIQARENQHKLSPTILGVLTAPC